MIYSRAELLGIIKELSKYAAAFLILVVFIIYKDDMSNYITSIGFGGMQSFVVTLVIIVSFILFLFRKYKYIAYTFFCSLIVMFFIFRGSAEKPLYQYIICFLAICIVFIAGKYSENKKKR